MKYGPGDLSGWEVALQSELEHLQTQRNEIDSQLQVAAKKLDLVRQMRLLENNPKDAYGHVITASKDARVTPIAVREMAQKVLSEASGPLHISEIHRQFQQRGYAIPGGGTAFNILAHLVNSKSFVRVARGTYALAGSVPPELILPRAPRKARQRRRKRRKAKDNQEGN